MKRVSLQYARAINTRRINMNTLILFALLATASTLPASVSDEITFDPEEKEYFINFLDLLRTNTAEVYSGNNSSDEHDKQTILRVIDKVQAATENDNWDQLDILPEDGPALLAVLKVIAKMGNSIDDAEVDAS